MSDEIRNEEIYDFSYELKSLTQEYASNNNSSEQRILNRALKSPTGNIKTLQDLSNTLSMTQGLLKSLIEYKSYILTYDHYIMPIDASKYKSKEDIRDARRKASKQVEKYNLKYNGKWITRRVITNGEIYLCIIKGKNSFLFYEFPKEMCKMTSVSDNMVCKFAINLNYINDSNINTFPQEIVNVYLKHKNGKLDKDKYLANSKNWYKVTGRNYAAFSLNMWEEKGVPYYVSLFKGINNIENLLDFIDFAADTGNFSLIHQKAEVDDKGHLKMERDKLRNYHEALKNVVNRDGYKVVTSPMEIKMLNGKGDYTDLLKATSDAKKSIYDSSGVNDNLFNGDTTNTEAVSIGFTVDCLMPLFIQKAIENWINDHMRSVRVTSNWFLEFVKTNEYNKSIEIEKQRNALTVYSPRWLYFATLGLTPMRAVSTLEAEYLEEIDEFMNPLLTAYTQTGDDVGRPSNVDTGKSNAEGSTNPNE